MRDDRRFSGPRAACALGLLLTMLLGAMPAAAADPLARSRKCRAVIAQQAGKATTVGLKLLDACHVQRDKGKRTDACLPLAAADPKGKLAKTRVKAQAAIDKKCAPDDAVRDNFPAGLVATALFPHLETLLAESTAALQGSPALAGDKQAVKCHTAIGKARRAIVGAILKRAATCQKALDKQAATFGALADACALDAGKAATKATALVTKACQRKGGPAITGAEVGSCTPLPACVVDAATATGQEIARATYTRPSACGDGIRAAGEACPGLEGDPAAPALPAVQTLDLEPGIPESEIEETAESARVARTRLEIELAPTATVGSVNDLLAELGASILMAVEGVPILLLQIPDPGSLVALEAVLAQARAHPAVATATAAFFAEPDLLPDNFDVADPATDLTTIDHQIAIRAPAAWNARGALPPLAARPLVVIGDLFGDGPPDATVDAAGVVASDFATGNLFPSGHGYHVLGIVGAAATGPACESPLGPPAGRGCATGTFPGTIRLRVVDLQAGLSDTGAKLRMIQRLLLAGHAILSTSLNGCGVGTCGNPFVAAEEGSKWARMVRLASLEGTVLHLTSAGNIKSTNPAVVDALTNSAFSAAALSADMVDFFGDPVPPLTNVLVIENARNTNVLPYVPRCLAQSSKRGGHLSGIGADVWSLRDATGTGFCGFSGFCAQDESTTNPTACTPGNSTPCQAGNKTGTSMATPQVAGLAAYLWALEPTLSVTELRALLVATAVPTGNDGGADPCDAAAPKPVIDAYAAVLALDGTATPPSPASAPVRHAILDADGDGVFDQSDLGLFLERYFQGFVDAGSHGPPVDPASRDYGRFDLNGDGLTGGPGRAPFDLDRVGSPPLGQPMLGRVFQELDEGGGVFFEQTGLTDLEILCYYAHSGLYEGTPAARAALVDRAWCNPVEVFASAGEEDLQPGEAAPLIVTVVYRDAAGVAQPLPDVRVEIAVGGGSGGTSATTDEAGQVERFVTPSQGSEEVEITVRVRPAAGGFLLAETSLSVDVDDDREPHDECDDFRPDGVYLEARFGATYGNTIASSFTSPTTSSFIYQVEDADLLRLRNDLPGAPSFKYFGSWDGHAAGTGSGSRSGVISSGAFAASQTSAMQGEAVVLEYPGGDPYLGFLFDGFTFEATAESRVSHSNTGAQRAESSSIGTNNVSVEFSVVGVPASFNFDGDLGPGAYVEFSGNPCADEHADFYYYYFNNRGELEDELPRGGLLQPGDYSLYVSLDAYSRISSNGPADGIPDYPDDKQHDLTLGFTVQ